MIKGILILDRVAFHIKNKGLLSFFYAVNRNIYELFYPARAKCYPKCLQVIINKVGLEIGGPSQVFSQKGLMLIYPLAKRVDNCNFASNTIWEGEIKDDKFRYGKEILGKQFIREATDLYGISDAEYDFVISSEMIQHSANPLRALYEWIRVIKDEGNLIMIVPHKKMTFDHHRKVTELQHLIDDFKKDTAENDLTHLEEILKYHDLSRDRLAGNYQQFKHRSELNHKYRALQHHVFDEKLVIEIVNYVGLQIIDIELLSPHFIIILARKISNTVEKDNSKYMSDKFKLESYSPNCFRSKMNWPGFRSS